MNSSGEHNGIPCSQCGTFLLYSNWNSDETMRIECFNCDNVTFLIKRSIGQRNTIDVLLWEEEE